MTPEQVETAIAQVRADVAALHSELVRYGLIVWTGGNVSGRVPGEDLFVIKPSGVSYDDLTPENMILCDLDGNVVPGTPGSERARRATPPRTPTSTGHAGRRRRRAHPLHLRRRVGGARRGDPLRDHRRWPTSSADRSRSARLRSSATTRSVAASSRRSRGHRSRAVLMQNHGPFTIGAPRRTP